MRLTRRATESAQMTQLDKSKSAQTSDTSVPAWIEPLLSL
jgi:hypothetical protein